MLTKVIRPTMARSTMIMHQARPFSIWANVDMAPADPILGLNDAFKKDNHPKKVLLGMGAYRDNDNKPLILDCVKKAEQKIL